MNNSRRIPGITGNLRLLDKLSLSLMGLMLFPALVFAQTGPVENGWGLDYEGKAIVAVLPFEGEADTGMALQRGTIQAVADLGKYNPREIPVSILSNAGLEIPTDMPPNRDIAAGARYTLTGGVYPGAEAGEYFLQLWLWNMSGSTMIYTDDLRYTDIDDALVSLPGLVEWLFSHIHEVSVDIPEIDTRKDPLLMAGFRAGVSSRWYTSPEEKSPGASSLVAEGGIYGAVRVNSLLSIQLDLLFSGDSLVYRGLNQNSVYFNENLSTLFLTVPLVVKLNFRPGPFRLSPLAGFYAALPLGQTGFQGSLNDEDGSYSHSVALAGVTAGFEAALDYGPGMLVAGLRYSGDFNHLIIDYRSPHSRDTAGDTRYRRDMAVFFLGYEFGFFDAKK